MASIEGSIFGIGNPLLDIMVDAQDADFAKYAEISKWRDL